MIKWVKSLFKRKEKDTRRFVYASLTKGVHLDGDNSKVTEEIHDEDYFFIFLTTIMEGDYIKARMSEENIDRIREDYGISE